MMRASKALCAALALAACGDDGSSSTPDAATSTPDASTACPRDPAPADRTRYVVVSHPYNANAERAGIYEVLELSQAGALTRFSPPRTFEMGRATFGTITFTPDGQLGFVATEDGKLAVFKLDAQGMPTVVTPGMQGTFYAGDITVAPGAQAIWVLDGNTRENGGGIYTVTLDCDGNPTELGNAIPADFPGAFVLMPGTPTSAMIAARSVFDASPAGEDIHHVLLDGDPPGRLGGTNLFTGEDAIVGGAAITHDGGFFLVGDTSAVHTNSIAIAKLEGGIAASATLMPFSDPQGIVASPFGDVAIATSTLDADEIHVLDRGGPQGAWRDAGEVSYAGAAPQLPGDLVMISRGSLAGHVFVSENVSIRHLAFRQDGSVDDLGSLQFGEGLEQIAGAIGVTP